MADLGPSDSPDSSYITPWSEWKKIAYEMDDFDPGSPATSNAELLNKYIEAKAVTYEDEAYVISDAALWDIYQQDFSGFTEEHFKKAYKKARIPTHLLRSALRRAGVFIPASDKKVTVASTMATVVHEETQHKWTLEDVKGLHIELEKGVVNSTVVKRLMKTLEPPTPRPIQGQIQEQIHESLESDAKSNVQDITTLSRPRRNLRKPAPRDQNLRNPANPPRDREPPPVDTLAAHQYYSNDQTQYPLLPPPPPQYQQQVGYSGYTGGYNGFNGGYQSVNTNYLPDQPQFLSNPAQALPSYPQIGVG
jgi:hypothetical protein